MPLEARHRSGTPEPPVCPVGAEILRRTHDGLLGLAAGDGAQHHRPRDLALLLIGEAWLAGYDALPDEHHPRLLITLTPRIGGTTPGSVELVHTTAAAYWRWADTHRPLTADPTDAPALVAEIDRRLRPRAARLG